MAKISLGVNMEFVRHADKSFEWGVAKAAELGYDYVEPMVHWGRELLSEAGYFHSVSMLDDPLRVKRVCQKHGIKVSGLSAHTPITKPEIGVEYLKQAIRFAAECGAPVVNTDEGPKQPWTTEEEDFVLMRYTLLEAAKVAEPRGILIGLEILIAADILKSVVVDPTLQGIAVLGGIVAIRTFLSISLDVEINGHWPWETTKLAQRAAETNAPQSIA